MSMREIMTNDELFAKLQESFPEIERAAVQVKDYLTVRIASSEQLAPLATWLKDSSFDMLDMLTATDHLAPVDMKGYITQMNFNPFLPDGATPQIVAAPTTGYPYRPALDLLWSFLSIREKTRVIVRLELPRENTSVPSLANLFKSADWQEREAFDLLGIRYEGHPNLTKILTPDFTQGHPLRKDYAHVKDRFDD